MKNITPSPLVFCFLSLLPLVACKQLKQIDSVQSSTQQMSNDTSNMNKQIGETSKKMTQTNEALEDLKKSTGDNLNMLNELYDSGRQGAALDLRNKAFQAMVSANSVDDKLVNSAFYYEAFEFELWSNLGADGKVGQREVLAKDAVEEFFNHLQTVAHWQESDMDIFVQPWSNSIADIGNQKAIFNMLAASLHKKNRKQITTSQDQGEEILSMYVLLSKALLAGKEIREGRARLADYPAYVDIVLRNESIAIRLLKDRYSMLGLVLLGRVTPIANSLWDGFAYKVLGINWDLDLSKLNQSQLLFYREHLTLAQDVKKLLNQLGIEVKLDPTLKQIYSHMHLNITKAKQGEVETQQVQTEALFSQALSQYLK